MNKITLREIKGYIDTHSIDLFPTQQALCIPIINRIYQKMINNLRFSDIKVCGELLMDGHHRYLSSLLAAKTVGRTETHRTSATVKYNWHAVNFVELDWDTEAKIQKPNKEDAEFNGLPLERVLQMTR